METARRLDEVQAQSAAERVALLQEKSVLEAEAKPKGKALDDALRRRAEVCHDPASRACLEAGEGVEAAHVGLTRNVTDRILVLYRLLDESAGRLVAQSDIVVGTIRRLEEKARGERRGNEPGKAEITEVEAKVRRFLDGAQSALTSAYALHSKAHPVTDATDPAKARLLRERAVGSKNVLKVVEALQRRSSRVASLEGEGMIERLRVLQVKLATVAAIAQVLKGALAEDAENVRVINAIVASSLAADTLGLFEHGLADSGRGFGEDGMRDIEAISSDVEKLIGGIGGGSETFPTDDDVLLDVP
jgi:hypothetical protein